MNKDVCEKIVATVNYLAVPVAVAAGGVAAIWGYPAFDISVYTVAFAGVVNSVWEFVKLFMKK